MTYTNNQNNGELYQAVKPELHPLRWLWWLLGALILGATIWGITHACTRTEPAIEATSEIPIGAVSLNCDGTPVEATVYAEHIVAQLNNEQFTLPQGVSADGARYTNGPLTLWEAQGAWSLIHNENTDNEQIIECTIN